LEITLNKFILSLCLLVTFLTFGCTPTKEVHIKAVGDNTYSITYKENNVVFLDNKEVVLPLGKSQKEIKLSDTKTLVITYTYNDKGEMTSINTITKE